MFFLICIRQVIPCFLGYILDEKVKHSVGETKTVKFIVKDQLLINDDLEYNSEPRDLDLMISSSSEDIRVKDTFE